MAEVRKREEIPEQFLPPKPAPDTLENLTIQIGDKKYPIPVLRVKEYKKLLKYFNEMQNKENLSEEDNIEFAQEFFYRLLKVDNPQLKKADMDDMPVWQSGAEFFIKVRLAMFRVPLG